MTEEANIAQAEADAKQNAENAKQEAEEANALAETLTDPNLQDSVNEASKKGNELASKQRRKLMTLSNKQKSC